MQETEQMIWTLFVGTFAMLMMAFFVISFVLYYQKRRFAEEKKMNDVEKNYSRLLLDTALNSEEAERRRIAQDLHDDIGTMLSLTKLSLNQLSKIVGENSEKESQIMTKTQSLVEETILHVRRITRDLVPTTLERFGLAEAIDEFIHKLEQDSTLSVTFNAGTEELPRQGEKIELTMYRIMQELVNNAIKHANCSTIEISLEMNDKFIGLRVSDNGIGFDPNAAKDGRLAGLGLLGIESRLAIVNGSMQYSKNGNGGTCALALVPQRTELSKNAPGPLHPFRREKMNI